VTMKNAVLWDLSPFDVTSRKMTIVQSGELLRHLEFCKFRREVVLVTESCGYIHFTWLTDGIKRLADKLYKFHTVKGKFLALVGGVHLLHDSTGGVRIFSFSRRPDQSILLS
jgi:hypothetical protein